MTYACAEKFTGARFASEPMNAACSSCNHALLAHRMFPGGQPGTVTPGLCELCLVLTEIRKAAQ